METRNPLHGSYLRVKSAINEFKSLFRTEWVAASTLSIIALIIGKKVSNLGFLLAIGIGIGYAFAFVLNDYFDRSYDSDNVQKATRNLFVKRNFGKGLVFLIGIVAVGSLLLIFSLFGTKGIGFLFLSLFIAWAYSARPFRFKSRAGVDLLVHSFFLSTYPYFLTVVLLDIKWNNLHYTILLATSFFSLGNQLENQLEDYNTDSMSISSFSLL